MNAHRPDRRCGYCARRYSVSDRVAEENPFCTACLHERIALAEVEARLKAGPS